VRVPIKRGERARRKIVELGYLDVRRAIQNDGDWLLIPIVVAAPKRLDLGFGHDIIYVDLPDQREPVQPRSLRESNNLSPEVAQEVTRALDIVGDVAIVRLPERLMPSAAEIGAALLAMHKRLRVVAVDSGVQGPHRIRKLEVVAGEGPLTTMHRENGIRLKVDLEGAYFSPRLATEHRLVANLVREGERVLDMFSGIGPFSVLIAMDGRAAEVHAVDINERASELVRENALLNKVADRVTVHTGDARAVVPKLGKFDRIIMNHPHFAVEFFDVALAAGRRGTMVHLHIIGSEGEADMVETTVLSLACVDGWSEPRTVKRREVGTFGPGVMHYCLDIEL
jgi:tRNA (guanine37-N1)-methyltransferase